MKNTLTVGDFLDHIRESIAAIHDATADLDLAALRQNRTVQLAVVKAIEIIGEAARSLERFHPNFVASQPTIPWRKIITMRNWLIHAYFDIKYDTVWNITQFDIHELEAKLAGLPKAE